MKVLRFLTLYYTTRIYACQNSNHLQRKNKKSGRPQFWQQLCGKVTCTLDRILCGVLLQKHQQNMGKYFPGVSKNLFNIFAFGIYLLNSLPLDANFEWRWERWLLKTSWKKEKMLVTSISPSPTIFLLPRQGQNSSFEPTSICCLQNAFNLN